MKFLVCPLMLGTGTLCGSLSDLKLALDIIEEDGPARGLLLNRNKSLLFAPQVMPPFPLSSPLISPLLKLGSFFWVLLWGLMISVLLL